MIATRAYSSSSSSSGFIVKALPLSLIALIHIRDSPCVSSSDFLLYSALSCTTVSPSQPFRNPAPSSARSQQNLRPEPFSSTILGEFTLSQDSSSSPSPQRMRTLSPSISAVHSSPLSSCSIASYPTTSSPFQPSSDLLFTDSRPQSPDLLEPFKYTPEMGADFRRIDWETSSPPGEDPSTPPPPTTRVLVPETPPPPLPQNQRTWVMFLGKVPGLYNTWYVSHPPPCLQGTHMILLASQQPPRRKTLVALSSVPILNVLLQLWHGRPTSGTERSPATVRHHGLFSLAENWAFSKECGYFCVISQQTVQMITGFQGLSLNALSKAIMERSSAPAPHSLMRTSGSGSTAKESLTALQIWIHFPTTILLHRSQQEGIVHHRH